MDAEREPVGRFYRSRGLGTSCPLFGGALARHARVVPVWLHRPPGGCHPPDDDASLPRLGRWDDAAPGISIGSASRPLFAPGVERIAHTVWDTNRVPASIALGHNPYLPEVDIRAAVFREARRAGRDHPRISVSGPLPLDGLIRLLQSCDTFVLPTRAEAWGLPILEAMACGLPCIVTDYGGHRTFANEANSYLIAIKQMRPARDPFVFPASVDRGEWAQPDLDHLAHLMRHVYENRDEAKAKGTIGRRQAVERWSWSNAAEIAMGHLRALVGSRSSTAQPTGEALERGMTPNDAR